MITYTLHKEQYLPITIEEAWGFFSDAANLSKITPPEMRFKVHTRLDGSPIYTGMRINYTVSPLFHIPLSWETVIAEVEAPIRFVDMQSKGPYALWQHTHTFATVPGGVKMTDEVKYALPFGVLGTIAHTLIVRRKVADIFAFREQTLIRLFGCFQST